MRLSSLFILSAIGLFTSCNSSWNSVDGEGPVVEEERTLSDFDEIELNTSADIYYQQSDEFAVFIETNENLMQYILTETKGSRLVIDTKDGTNIDSKEGIKIFIYSPQINEIVLNGSGSFFADEVVKTDDLNCEISGSGNINFKKLICDSYSMGINGSGDITLAGGKSKNGVFSINGSGDVYASKAKTENLEIEINGSGNVEAFASKQLTVSVVGSGDVYYKGNPKKDIDITGSGNVEKM